MAPGNVETVFEYTILYKAGKINESIESIMPSIEYILANSSSGTHLEIKLLIAIAFVEINKSMVVPI